jgi:hypothetical protein
LKKFRELEEKKRLQLIALESGEHLPVQTAEEKKVARREEKLKEINNRRAAFGRGKVARKAMFNRFSEPAEPEDPHDQYDKINGEKILREYGANGLRNAIHFIVAKPAKSMVEYLLSLKINPDLPDYDEVTPFNVMSQGNVNVMD